MSLVTDGATALSAALLPSPRLLIPHAGPGPAVAGLHGLVQLPSGLRELARALLPIAEMHAEAAQLSLELAAPVASRAPQLGDDESFRLHLSADLVQLQAATPAGARHGLHALSQLWHAARAAGQARLPALTIEDAPRYPWRGLLVDVARRPLPMDALLRLLDTMAAARLNVLHWHLCDDQAWRLASDRYPRLQEKADGGFHYTLAQAEALVSEASARGIRVVPELDLPGHCWALGLAYPELLCPPAPTQPQRAFGVFGCAVDPESEALYEFLDGLLGEWAAVFPDRYLHLGGDELATQPWERLAAERGRTVAQLQATYLSRVGEVLQRHGRRLVAWDELGETDAALPPGSVLQAWRGEGALRFQPAGAAGRLRSAGYYLDQTHASAYHWRRRPQAAALPTPPESGTAWSLEAMLGWWKVEGQLWLDAAGGPRLWLRSTGTLVEGLAPELVSDPLCQWRLRVDSDLGELEFWGPEVGTNEEGGGWLRQGNRRVPCRWQALGRQAADAWPSVPAPAAEMPVLGGEAALWSELVEAPQLGLRFGPRLLAVADRLWSDVEPNELALAELPQRLLAAQQWMEDRGRVDVEAPQSALLSWLEPGAGYARQHTKKAREAYNLDEALDRLADALPSESRLMLVLGDSPEAWATASRDLQRSLPAWRALPVASALLDQLECLAELGLRLWCEPASLSREEAAAAQRALHEAAALVDEMVPALVNPLQRRLDARCSQEPWR